MAKCRECQAELQGADAVRCAACGKRQAVDPMIYLLIIAVVLAIGVGYVIVTNS